MNYHMIYREVQSKGYRTVDNYKTVWMYTNYYKLNFAAVCKTVDLKKKKNIN